MCLQCAPTSAAWCDHCQHSWGGLVDGVEAEVGSSKPRSLQAQKAAAAAAAAVAASKCGIRVDGAEAHLF
jgi:hypothetical protein